MLEHYWNFYWICRFGGKITTIFDFFYKNNSNNISSLNQHLKLRMHICEYHAVQRDEIQFNKITLNLFHTNLLLQHSKNSDNQIIIVAFMTLSFINFFNTSPHSPHPQKKELNFLQYHVALWLCLVFLKPVPNKNLGIYCVHLWGDLTETE